MEIALKLIKFKCFKSYIHFYHICKLREKNVENFAFFAIFVHLKGNNSFENAPILKKNFFLK